MRTALYCRISRDEEGEGLGVARQEEDCRALAARHGWEIAQAYVDNDVSAYSGRRRPGYSLLLQAIEQQQIDAVIAWAPERLHRSPRELEDFIELIERTGIRVETVKAGAWDVSSSHGRLVARMLGAVSRAESERTGERVSRAHQQAKAAGRWRGPIPFGMRATAAPGRPEPDPLHAALVRGIFARVLRGDALTRIAADLTKEGIRPRRGDSWTHTGILRLVSSPALGGLVLVNGELIQGDFDGVVDEETWRSARAALRRRPRGETRRPREKLTLLGGIMHCEQHGHVCVGGSAAHAATYVASGPGKCNVSITRAAADSLVTSVVLERLKRPDARELLTPTVAAAGSASEAAELRARRDDIAELIADGLLAGSTARERLQAISTRLEELEAQAHQPAYVSTLVRDPETVWEALAPTQRREIVRLLFEDVTLRHVGPAGGPVADPTRVGLRWASE